MQHHCLTTRIKGEQKLLNFALTSGGGSQQLESLYEIRYIFVRFSNMYFSQILHGWGGRGAGKAGKTAENCGVTTLISRKVCTECMNRAPWTVNNKAKFFQISRRRRMLDMCVCAEPGPGSVPAVFSSELRMQMCDTNCKMMSHSRELPTTYNKSEWDFDKRF